MLILAVDTTNEKGGVALYRGGECLALVANEGAANLYSVTLFTMVERLLTQTNLKLGDIDLFAVARGPGSFTGIRVGVAATQGWAVALGRQVYGASVLEALVEEARPQTDWVVPILDARRGEFFLNTFRRLDEPSRGSGSGFQAEGDGWVLRRADVPAFMKKFTQPGATVTCLAREQDPVVLDFLATLPGHPALQKVEGTLLGGIARLALKAQRMGRLQKPQELDACYIRRPDAELSWRG